MASTPAALKPIQPYLMLNKQFAKRDPVAAYYAKMYAVQEGIKSAKDPESKAFLLKAMDELDELKRGRLKEEEALHSDIVAQAHMEEVGFKLFEFADKEDRAGRFSKNMIKAFLTSAHIFTTLKQFGEIGEEIEPKMKYAKWKAVEIDRCLKSGITPTPGPPGASDDQGAVGGYDPTPSSFSGPGDASTSYPPPGERPVPKPRHNVHPDPPAPAGFSVFPDPTPAPQGYTPQNPAPPTYTSTPSAGYGEEPSSGQGVVGNSGAGGFKAGQEETTKAQKLLKYASSSLDYDDVDGAIQYMSSAIRLLKTGKE